jgi:prenyltransferase beta subunit
MAPHQMTILYFIMGSLKILNNINEDDINLCLEFVLNNAIIYNGKIKGFRGGIFTGFSYNDDYKVYNYSDIPHIAATYCALCIIKMSGVDKQEINDRLYKIYGFAVVLHDEYLLHEVKKNQKQSGNISCQSWDSEDDVRFFYCACAIHRLLDYKGSEIDVDRGVNYLDTLRNYEGGFGMIQGSESNGITY